MCQLVHDVRAVLANGEVTIEGLRIIQDAASKALPDLQNALNKRELESGRYLLYKDCDYGFVVMMLVWSKGDCTPIHAHGTWGVEMVVKNHVRITNYSCCPTQPKEQGSVILPPGSVAYVMPPDADVHCVAQWGDQQAITVHIYGKELTQNIVFSPGEGFKAKSTACKILDIDLFDIAARKQDFAGSQPFAIHA